MQSSSHRAPLIVAIALLVLPVLYVGSYLALLQEIETWSTPQGVMREPRYRVSGPWIADFFWPLEQIDRKVRLGAWEPVPVGPFDDDETSFSL